MTPAPKSRVPKGQIVEDTHLQPSGEPTELNSDAPHRSPSIRTNGRRRSSIETPLPRFQMRIPHFHKDPDSADRWITHIGATDEIREHLKHLGPSNLASRPRQTRYQNVKIKRGVDSPNPPPLDSIRREDASDPQINHSVTMPLLPSAEMEGTASPDYGSVSTGGHPSHIATPSSVLKSGNVTQMPIPEIVNEDADGSRHSKGSGSSQSATMTGRSVEAKRDDPLQRALYIHDGPARSGSITEQVVDVNGVRKMVLSTNSTSSSEVEGAPPAPSEEHNRGHHDESAVVSEVDTSANRKTHPTPSKKRRKRRKRTVNSPSKPGKKDEEQPLLQQ